MKCIIAFGLLALASVSKAQFPTGDAGDGAAGGRLLNTGSGDGRMSNMLGGGDGGSMSLARLLSGAGGIGSVGSGMSGMGGMFRGMTGATGQMGQMGNLLRMMGPRRMGFGLGGMGGMGGMGRGMGFGNNMMTYSMLRGKSI